MDLGDVVLVRGDGAGSRCARRCGGFYESVRSRFSISVPVPAHCQKSRHSPFNKILKVFLDKEADLVLDSRDVGGICGAGSVGNLIIFEALPFVVAWSTETLRGWCSGSSGRGAGHIALPPGGCARSRETIRHHEPSIAGNSHCCCHIELLGRIRVFTMRQAEKLSSWTSEGRILWE